MRKQAQNGAYFEFANTVKTESKMGNGRDESATSENASPATYNTFALTS